MNKFTFFKLPVFSRMCNCHQILLEFCLIWLFVISFAYIPVLFDVLMALCFIIKYIFITNLVNGIIIIDIFVLSWLHFVNTNFSDAIIFINNFVLYRRTNKLQKVNKLT